MLLISACWMGVLHSARKTVEPKALSPIFTVGLIAFALHFMSHAFIPCIDECYRSGFVSLSAHTVFVFRVYEYCNAAYLVWMAA